MKKRLEKFFVRIAGEDIQAYRKCADSTQLKILMSGLLVCLIFVISLLSITEAFTQFFNSMFVGILTGLFFAWVVANLYILLLYTLSRNVLAPNDKDVHSKSAVAIRICTVAFFAIVVSKPIEHFLFQKYVATEIIVLRAESRSNILQKSNSVNQNDIERGLALVDANNYYIESIKKLSEKVWPWSISLVLVFLFISPVLLKRSISEESYYYKILSENQRAIIDTDYATFKQQYADIINQYTQEELEYSEPYSDPPYNFRLINKHEKYLKESDFLENIYG